MKPLLTVLLLIIPLLVDSKVCEEQDGKWIAETVQMINSPFAQTGNKRIAGKPYAASTTNGISACAQAYDRDLPCKIFVYTDETKKCELGVQVETVGDDWFGRTFETTHTYIKLDKDALVNMKFEIDQENKLHVSHEDFKSLVDYHELKEKHQPTSSTSVAPSYATSDSDSDTTTEKEYQTTQDLEATSTKDLDTTTEKDDETTEDVYTSSTQGESSSTTESAPAMTTTAGAPDAGVVTIGDEIITIPSNGEISLEISSFSIKMYKLRVYPKFKVIIKRTGDGGKSNESTRYTSEPNNDYSFNMVSYSRVVFSGKLA